MQINLCSLVPFKQNYDCNNKNNYNSYANLVPLKADIVSFRSSLTEQKTYINNVQKVNLPQNLKLPKFKTREEAVKFAKETLKIIDIEDNVTLPILNDVLDAIVDISNKNNGKFYNAFKISSTRLFSLFAGVELNLNNKNFGILKISNELYNSEELDWKLKQCFHNRKGISLPDFTKECNQKKEIMLHLKGGNFAIFSPNFVSLLNKYFTNPNDMTVKEKQTLFLSYANFLDQSKLTKNKINEILKKLSYKDKQEITEEFKKNCPQIQKENIMQKIKDDPTNFLVTVNKICNRKGISMPYYYDIKTMNEVIYHEFGHLQDIMANQDYIENEYLRNKRYLKKDHYLAIKNQEFFKNKNEQNIAGQVSLYAQSSVGEFIAEVYKKLIKDDIISDDIMSLYKKYNGPMLNS